MADKVVTKAEPKAFRFTDKQLAAQMVLSGAATHIMLYGGSRSGKTFLHVRNIVFRALKAPNSHHCILRFRFNHLKASVILGTFPKVMKLCFPNVKYNLSKTDWYVTFPNGSELWFGGLDDKERTEKILGQEYSTMLFNESSQIPKGARDTAITRLAELAETKVMDGDQEIVTGVLQPRAYYDCNPTNKNHWTYREFIQKLDPETRQPLPHPEDYAFFKMNPEDNKENLTANYLQTLGALSTRMRKRFKDGEFADATPNALFKDETIDAWRVQDGILPDMQRIVVAVDPSGSGDRDNLDNDAIGIVVAGLGVDGNAYVLEDCTIKAGPAIWGKVVVSAYDRHEADIVVGEVNYGGAMVRHVIVTIRPRVNFRNVTATRGKVVRAEPFSALYEEGKIRHVGNRFQELEDEVTAFSTMGYLGPNSPNRADALFWALTELFPGIVSGRKNIEPVERIQHEAGAWLG
jgi:phage terminase large subunit-like protein